MNKLMILAAFAGFGLAIAQEAPASAAPAAPAAPAPEAKAQVQPRPQRPAPNSRELMLERQQRRLSSAANEIVAMYDANKDGKLDDTEKAAMKADFEKFEKLQRLTRDFRIIQRLDKDGDMVLSKEELEKIPAGFGNRDGIRPMPMPGMRPGLRDGQGPRGNGPRDGQGPRRNGPRDGKGPRGNGAPEAQAPKAAAPEAK